MKKIFTYPVLIRMGLALVFFANALAAFFAPDEFKEIFEQSFIAGIVPIPFAVMLTVIRINDTLVSLLLFSGIGARRVALWAALWIVGVIALRGISLGSVEELGFLAMALALVSDGGALNKQKTIRQIS